MQEKELSVIISVVGWVLGVVGSLIAIIGSFIGYIFTRHREDNDCDIAEIKDLIFAVRDELKNDIVRVHDRIDSHIEAE
jgi:hypothetical protein